MGNFANHRKNCRKVASRKKFTGLSVSWNLKSLGKKKFAMHYHKFDVHLSVLIKVEPMHCDVSVSMTPYTWFAFVDLVLMRSFRFEPQWQLVVQVKKIYVKPTKQCNFNLSTLVLTYVRNVRSHIHSIRFCANLSNV